MELLGHGVFTISLCSGALEFGNVWQLVKALSQGDFYLTFVPWVFRASIGSFALPRIAASMLLFPKILSDLAWFCALMLCNLVALWLLNVCDFSRAAAPLCSGVLMLLCMIQQLCFEKIL